MTTLTADKDSMLAAMFSGRFSLEKDEDGCYFIDRNGKHFSYILDYLRNGSVAGNISKDTLQELEKEASYYQLTRLVQSIGGPRDSEEDTIVWSSIEPVKNSNGYFLAKSTQDAEREITAFIKRGYFPIKTIDLSQTGKIVLFSKQR